MATIDLDDTSGCPVGARCESCGSAEERTVRTATTAVGVLCLTLCPRCAAASSIPSLSPTSAVRFVLDHCGHLGIDADEMAAAMGGSRR